MADNVNVTPGSGVVVAADDVGGVSHQRVKITLGADGVSDGDISSTNPMPVTITGGVELEFKNDSGNPLPINGTVTVVQATGSSLHAMIDNFPTTQAVSGSISVSNFPSSQLVTGTFWQSVQPVSGSVSVSNFPSSQTVAGTVTANIGTTNGLALDATLTSGSQKSILRSGTKGATTASDVTSTNIDVNTQALDVSIKGTPSITVSSLPSLPAGSNAIGSVSVSNFPATQSVTGTVVVTQATGTNLHTTVDNFPSTQAVSATTLPLPTGAATEITLSGLNTKVTTTANGIKVDGSAVTQPISGSVSITGTPAISGTVTVQQATGSSLHTMIDNFPTTQAVSGSISVSNFPSSQLVTGTFWQTTQPVSLASVPTHAVTQSGTWTTGRTWSLLNTTDSVNVGNFPSSFNIGNFPSTQAVTGTFWQTTQPVSIATMPTTPVTGTFWQATQPVSGSVSVSNFPTTQPVSGTVTSNIGTGNLAGINSTVTIKADTALNQTNALKVDGSATTQPISGSVSISGTPSVNVSNFPATQPVSIASSVAVTGPLTDTQLRASAVPTSIASLPLPSGASTEATLSALNTKIPSSLTVTSTRLLVDGSGVTQPVSGTVTANTGLTQPLTDTQLRATSVPISGAVSVSNFPSTQAISATTLPLPSGASTETTLSALNSKVTAVNTGAVVISSSALPTGASTSALQTTGNSSLSSIDGKLTTTANGIKVDGSAVTQPISGSVSITGTPAISGTVTVQQATGTNLHTVIDSGAVTATISGTPTIANTSFIANAGTNLNTSALALETTQTTMSAKLPASLGAKTIANSMSVNIASDQIVPVSGTVTANTGLTQPLTDTQLRASYVPVSGTVTSNIGTTNGLALDTTLTSGSQKSIVRSGTKGTTTASDVTSTNIDVNTQALDVSIKGTSNVTVSSLPALPAGSNAIGSVSVSNFPSSQSVTGTVVVTQATGTNLHTTVDNFPSIQVISASSLPLPTGAATEITLSAINGKMPALGQALMAASQPVVIASNQSSIPVSGTVTANLGTIDGIATETTLASINTKIPGLGNKVMSLSQPVTMASDQPAIPVSMTQIIPHSYSVGILGLAPANSPTDILTITGSATTIVKVKRIIIQATQTTGTVRDILLIKRSTLNTGGTSSVRTLIPHDSTSPAATSVVSTWTVNPTTLGTVVGTIKAKKALISTTTVSPSDIIFDFGVNNTEDLFLRGVNECLALNLNAITSAGNLFNIIVELTEV